MGLPIDINKLKQAASSIQKLSDTTLRINVYVDTTCPRQLASNFIDLLKCDSVNVVLKSFNITNGACYKPNKCDLAIILCGNSKNCILTYIANINNDNNAVMITCNPAYIYKCFKTIGIRPVKSDIIFPSPRLFDKTHVNKKIKLDTSKFNSKMWKDIEYRFSCYIVSECWDLKLPFAKAFEFLRPAICDAVVRQSALQNCAIGIFPVIPGGDMPFITLNQAKMLLQIASINGYDAAKSKVVEIVILAITAFSLKRICSSLKGSFKKSSMFFNGAVSWAGTTLLGHLFIKYVNSGQQIDGFVDYVYTSISKSNFSQTFLNTLKQFSIDNVLSDFINKFL